MKVDQRDERQVVFGGQKHKLAVIPLIHYQLQMQLVHQSFDVWILFDEIIKQKLSWLLLQKIVGNVQSVLLILFGCLLFQKVIDTYIDSLCHQLCCLLSPVVEHAEIGKECHLSAFKNIQVCLREHTVLTT